MDCQVLYKGLLKFPVSNKITNSSYDYLSIKYSYFLKSFLQVKVFR